MCGAFERKENDFWELKKMIHTHDTAIKKWSSSPLKFKNQDLHDLFLEFMPGEKITPNCKYLAPLDLLCNFCRTALVYKLVHRRGL